MPAQSSQVFLERLATRIPVVSRPLFAEGLLHSHSRPVPTNYEMVNPDTVEHRVLTQRDANRAAIKD